MVEPGGLPPTKTRDEIIAPMARSVWFYRLQDGERWDGEWDGFLRDGFTPAQQYAWNLASVAYAPLENENAALVERVSVLEADRDALLKALDLVSNHPVREARGYPYYVCSRCGAILGSSHSLRPASAERHPEVDRLRTEPPTDDEPVEIGVLSRRALRNAVENGARRAEGRVTLDGKVDYIMRSILSAVAARGAGSVLSPEEDE